MIEKRDFTSLENTTESDRERILEIFNIAKEYLRSHLDIDNLSVIEGVRLRQLVETCFKQEMGHYKELGNLDQEITRRKKENLPTNVLEVQYNKLTLWGIDTPYEAAYRWLLELYNIDIKNIKRTGFWIKDSTTGEIYRYTKKQDEEFNDKLKKLKQMGHVFARTIGAEDPTDIEYIRRLREKAHLI